MHRLAIQEPEFYKIWAADQDPKDPQLERWAELEASQIQAGVKTVERLGAYFPVAGRRVLDVGCQWGATSIALAKAGADVCGIDVYEPFVRGAAARAARHGAAAEFRTAAGEALPYPDASFDAVVCVNVIEHVRSHDRTVAELVRVTKPGGHVFLEGPNRFGVTNVRSDPHYRMRLISTFPHWLGKLYVTKVRGLPRYDVGVFPLASSVVRLFRRHGAEVVASSRREPHSLDSWARFNLRELFHVVARKS
jgi:ubiquinone/menaquinone biosynthesis C-methylase UbiE